MACFAREHKIPSRDAHTCSDKHLCNLRHGNKNSGKALGAHVEGLQAVITVHEGVDCVVHGHKIEAATGNGRIGAPAKEEHSDVVIPVQKNELTLAQDNEDSVNELGNLGVDKKHDPKTAGTNAPASQR